MFLSFCRDFKKHKHNTTDMTSLKTNKIFVVAIFLWVLLFCSCSCLAMAAADDDDAIDEEGGNADANGAEEWRLATATYVKDHHQLSSITGGACGYGDLDEAGYGRDTTGLSSALFGRGGACGACFEIRCVDHIRWCLQGSPSIVVTATDFCAPNWGLPDEDGGWCNFPREHFEMSVAAFAGIAKTIADIVPVQYRRVKCQRKGGMRFTLTGSSYFHQVLITNVGSDGEITAVKVKGTRTGWISMGRNWGQIWQCDADLRDQPLSFEVTTRGGGTVTSFHVAPSDWQFRQTFVGKQFV